MGLSGFYLFRPCLDVVLKVESITSIACASPGWPIHSAFVVIQHDPDAFKKNDPN